MSHTDDSASGVTAIVAIFVIVVLVLAIFFGAKYINQRRNTKVDVNISVPTQQSKPVPAPSK